MYFAGFSDGLINVIRAGAAAEMNCDRVLSSGDIDDGWM